VPAGALLRLGRLKYQPLFPVGTQEFEATAAGWLRYVDCIVRLAMSNYGEHFDVEIWNELTFGSEFLDINNYYDPRRTAVPHEFLHAGGAAWELARRTVAEIAKLDPSAGIIWGFSNTSFFHTAIADLPPGVSGRSYHPYGTGPRCYAGMVAGKERYNVGGFVPSGCAVMPEGWAQTFQQTETLMRVLNPNARAAHPPGVGYFRHFMTEHGLSPRELGITDRARALRAKEKFLLRAPLFWLNKGIAGLYVYSSYYPDDLLFGMLLANGGPSPAMRVLRRTVAQFAGAAPVASPRSVGASVVRMAGPGSFYANDPGGEQVAQQQMVAVLPFQVNDHRFVVGLYVMTENFPADLPPQEYRISISGISGRGATVRYYDPLTDAAQPVRRLGGRPGQLAVSLALTDTPRLLEITES